MLGREPNRQPVAASQIGRHAGQIKKEPEHQDRNGADCQKPGNRGKEDCGNPSRKNAFGGLTPELSRPAAGRRLDANIAEGVQSGAAPMRVRLERIVRRRDQRR